MYIGLQCLLRSEAADRLWWDCKLLTYICWHFQIPGPRCEPSQLVPTQWWFSPRLLTVTYKVNFIRRGFFFFSLCQVGKEFISVQCSKLLLLPGFHCFTVLPGVLSFKNSNCVLTGYVFLFVITEDRGPRYTLRFQAAHCRDSLYYSLFHFSPHTVRYNSSFFFWWCDYFTTTPLFGPKVAW